MILRQVTDMGPGGVEPKHVLDVCFFVAEAGSGGSIVGTYFNSASVDQDKEMQRIVVDRCGSYNAAAECVINSDIASRDDNSELSEKERTDLVHAGKFSFIGKRCKSSLSMWC